MPALNLTQRVVFQTLLQVFGKLVALGVALGSTKIATQYLGVDVFGDFAVVVVIASLVIVVADLGLSTLLARELGRSPGGAEDLLATAFTFRLASCAALAIVFAVVIPFFPYSQTVRYGIAIGVAGALVGVMSLFPVPVLQANLRLDRIAVAEVVARVFTLAAMAVVAILDWGFLPLATCAAIGWGASLVVAFRFARPFWVPRIRLQTAAFRRLLAATLPLGAVTVLGLIHFKVDIVLLSIMRPSRDVATYAVAYAVVEQAFVLPALLMAGVFPILSRMVALLDPSAPIVVDRAFRFLTLTGLALACGTTAFAGPLVHLISSDDYGGSIEILRLLAAALVPLFAAPAIAAMLVARGRVRWLIATSSFGILLNVVLNVLLIPAYGGRGAALATVVCETVALALMWEGARRDLGRPAVTFASLVRVAVTAMATSGALYLAWSLPRAVGFMLTLVALGAAVVVTRAVTPADLRLVFRRENGAVA